MSAKISVITPIYKTEAFLDKCLPSLTAQTLPDVELIWIDNGASDECRRLIEKYKTPAVKVVSLPENIGYMRALNKGLDAATGEYVGFCDSDDWVDADYFEKLYATAKKNNSDICFCSSIIEESGKRQKILLRHYNNTNNAGEAFDALQNGSIWRGLYAREMIERAAIRLPDTDKSVFRDNLFLIQSVLASKRFSFCPDAFYNYFQHAGSTTNHLSIDVRRQETILILRELSDKIADHPALAGCLASFADFLCRSLGLSLLFAPDDLKDISLFARNPLLLQKVAAYRTYRNPRFFQRIFSVSKNSIQTRIKIRFLGVALSFKYLNLKGEKL